MESQVEKMYENCNIKKIRYCEVEDECPFMFGHRCEDCDMKPKPEYYIYPPFTAEKQIELIKWLAKSKSDITICYSNVTERFAISKRGGYCVSEDFATALAIKINLLWQDLTEEECKQIKEILE